MIVFLDIETRSEIDLAKRGVANYAAHSSTSILCLWFYLPSQREPWVFWKHGDDPRVINQVLEDSPTVVAHNVSFEREIWRKVATGKYGFAPIKDAQWFCTMAQASFNGLPKGLDALAKALNLDVAKDTEGRRAMLKLSKPRKATKNNLNQWHSGQEDFATLYAYCKQDVIVTFEAFKNMPLLSEKEYRLWQIDQGINQRGVSVDLNLINSVLNGIEKVQLENDEKIKVLTNGQVTTARRVGALREYLNQRGVVCDSLNKESVTALLASTSDPVAKQLLRIRQSSSMSSNAKYKRLKAMVTRGGTVKDNLVYYSTITGRWAGKGVQLQNLPRGKYSFDDQERDSIIKGVCNGNTLPEKYETSNLYSSLLRSAIVPRAGKIFYCVDFANIESRVLLWLAQDDRGLKLYEDNVDLYKDFAAKIYQKPISDINKDERMLGKTAILGLGYGMGAKKFHLTANAGGCEVSESQAEETVRLYRQVYRKIPVLWRMLGSAVTDAIHHGTAPFSRLTLTTRAHGGFRFLAVKLPSGREIKYPFPTFDFSEGISYFTNGSLTRKWESTRTYGGKLVENITQGIARDILAEALMAFNARAGVDVVVTVHDELLCEVDSGAEVDALDALAAQCPLWAKGLPMAVDSWTGTRYKK